MKKTFLRTMTYALLVMSYLQAGLVEKAVPQGQLLLDGDAICARKFYEVNEEGRRTATIIDDGSAEDPCDLADVHIRLIERIAYVDGKQLIERSYFDSEVGLEIPIGNRSTLYDHSGNPVEETINDHYYRLTLDQGTNVEQHESTGRSLCFEKDEIGRLLSIRDSDSALERSYEYDDLGRLTAYEGNTTIAYPEPGVAVVTHEDGRQTTQLFDLQGRPTKTIGPALPSCSAPPEREVRYDSRGNVVYQRSPTGEVTTAEYSKHNQLLWLRHPDGTQEQWEYHPEGGVAAHKTPSGTTHRYTRDGMDRVVREEVFDRRGVPLYEIDTQYCLVGPTRISDSRGKVTLFKYDGAGRLTREEQHSHEGHTLFATRYLYGQEGELAEKVDLFGSLPEEERHICYERDEKGDVLAIRIEDGAGKILAHHAKKEKAPAPVTVTLQEDGAQAVAHALPEKTLFSLYNSRGQLETQEEWGLSGTLLKRTQISHQPLMRTVREENIVEGEVAGASITVEEFDEQGRLTVLTLDAEGQNPATTHYTYNEWGEVIEEKKPDGSSLFFTYDAEGNLATRKSSRGDIDESFTYDAYGNLCAFSNASGTTTREYDAAGHIICETSPSSMSIQRSFDTLGRCTALHLPDGSSVRYHYDAEHLRKVERIAANATPAYNHEYTAFDWEGRLLSATMAHGVGTLSYQWSSEIPKPTDILSPFWQQSAQYDQKGLLEQLVTTDLIGTREQHFIHDEQHRLLQELSSNEREVAEHRYRYDSLDNRIEKDHQILEISSGHELLFDGEYHYTYDANGNLVERSNEESKTLFSYDSRDRLTAITTPQEYRVEYEYDPLNRITKETRYSWDKGIWLPLATHHHLHDGFHDIGTCNEKGEIVHLRVLGQTIHGNDVGSCIAIEIRDEHGLQSYAPIHDLFGSLSCLVDAEGAIAQTYRYDAYGQPTGQYGTAQLDNPWRFSNKRWDSHTNLYHFENRLYDPKTSRWLSRDPTGRLDGPNPYAYVHNDPLHHLDPHGLWSVGSWLSSAASWASEGASNLWYRITMSPYHSSYFLLQDLYPCAGEGEFPHEFFNSIFQRWTMIGFEPQTLLTGTIGKGEVSDKVRVSFMNGILTEDHNLFSFAEQLSVTHGNVNVHYVYRPTHGYTWDVWLSGFTRVLDYTAEQSYAMAEKWKALIEELGGPESGGLIIHYAHSIGSVDSTLAKELLSPEEQKMIRIITIGAPRMTSEEGLEGGKNYVSMRDGISLVFDPVGVIKGATSDQEHVILVGSIFDGIPLCDHLIAGETYRKIWEQLGSEFVEEFGAVE